MKKIIYFSIGLVGIAFLYGSCARQGVITGGEKDITPPVLTKANPANYSINFDKKKFELGFNEYINGSAIASKLFISPPFKKKPRVLVKASSFVVSFSDSLKENTTYTFNFGNTICDLNENNPLRNFEYVFSTGSYLDSLGIKGQIYDAFTLEPENEGYYAALYSNLNDSAPYKQIPDYISSISRYGIYTINNVKPGIYRLYALKDANNNLKFDPKSDKIAFADTLIHLDPSKFIYKDTAAIKKTDTLEKIKTIPINPKVKSTIKNRKNNEHDLSKKLANDTLLIDSIMNLGSIYALYADMYLFKENEKTMRLKDFGRRNRRSLSFKHSNPIDTNIFSINPIYYQNNQNWYLPEFFSKSDSIIYWITDTTLIMSDTLRLKVKYPFTNKNNIDTIRTDTLMLRFQHIENKKAKVIKEKMSITSNINGTLDLDNNVKFTIQYPVNYIDTSKIVLSIKKDSVYLPEKFVLKIDTNAKRSWIIDFKKNENKDYKLLIPQGAAQCIYGLEHDTLSVYFKTQSLNYYASIIVNLTNVKCPLILQLLKGDVVYKQLFTSNDSKLVFKYLNPEEYSLKLIYDTNANGIWDTGDFLRKIQAEKVDFYRYKKSLRSNSEYEIDWEVK